MSRTHNLIAALLLALVARAALANGATTIITHGYSLDGSKGAWVEMMGEAILARAGATGAILRYQPSNGAWRIVSGTLDSNAPVIMIFNWLDDFEKAGPNWGFAEAAADAFFAALRDPQFENGAGDPLPSFELLLDRPVHFIGHSRGAIVNSEAIERLAHAGIPIDQYTALDPHPVNGTLDPPYDYDWGDPVPRVWSNVAFADDYWRADGGGIINGLDFDGMPIPGAHNVQLSETALNCCAYTFAHSDVHLWYHGTIDIDADSCDGDYCITQQMRDTWWPNGWTQTGWHFSALGGGVNDRPALPTGIAPGVVPTVFGGDFDQQALAGWLYHGGAFTGSVVNEGGRSFVRLTPGQRAVHNRMFLGSDASAITFDLRVFAADPASEFVIEVTDLSGTIFEVMRTSLATVGEWMDGMSTALPVKIPDQTTVLLGFRVEGGAGANVGVDTIAIVYAPPPSCPGDFDEDGGVDFDDFTELLASWGPCEDCAADLDRDGVVDFDDFTALLAAWGPCR